MISSMLGLPVYLLRIYSNLMLSTTTFTNVNFTSNNYSRYNGEVLYIENIINYNPLDRIFVHTSLMDCTFYCNSASDYVVFLNTILHSR